MKIPDLCYLECKHPKTVSLAHMRKHDIKIKVKVKKKKKSDIFPQLTC